MEAFNAVTSGISEAILAHAGDPWVYLLVFVCCTVDGFFPPFPSESVVVALASLIMSQGVPNPWLLFAVAALGAFAGDNIAYSIGKGIGTTRFRWMHRPRIRQSFDWAREELAKRPASLILVARFVPIGRVAVNLTAGALGYSRRNFTALTVMSGVIWAAYSVAIGALAGSWFQHNHLLGMLVAMVVAVVLGLVVDRIISSIQGPTRRHNNPLQKPMHLPARHPAQEASQETLEQDPAP